MKRRYKWLLVLTILILSIWGLSNGSWHTARNDYNLFPVSGLTHLQDNIYLDTLGIRWELQPHSMNTFHQPVEPIEFTGIPYAPVLTGVEYDPEYPNLKFLSVDDEGGSYEAILQPNGQFLNTGPLLGTYNYCHPEGFFGKIGHGILDVIPHLFCGTYDSTKTGN